MRLNIELLRRAIAWARAEAAAMEAGVRPSAWNQAAWACVPDSAVPASLEGSSTYLEVTPGCGTTLCIAGWTCYDAGDQFEGSSAGQVVDEEGWPTGQIELSHVLVRGRPGKSIPVNIRAARLLGLTDRQAYRLFYSNSLEQVVQEATTIAAESGYDL